MSYSGRSLIDPSHAYKVTKILNFFFQFFDVILTKNGYDHLPIFYIIFWYYFIGWNIGYANIMINILSCTYQT